VNWLKWHVGTFTDPKFAVIAKKAGQPRANVIAVWAALLETACNDEKRGSVSSFNPEDIGIALDIEPEHVMAIFNAIMARGMVTEDKQLAAWGKRNIHDYSTDRVRKYRENQKAAANELHNDETDETRSIVSETVGNERNAEEKRGEEKRLSPSPKRATRLPSDWKLPDDWRAYCLAERIDLDPDRVAADFRDYWLARAGPDAAKLDWAATWRRWVRNQKAGNGNRTHNGRQRLDPAEQQRLDRAAILKGMGLNVPGGRGAGAGVDRTSGAFGLEGGGGEPAAGEPANPGDSDGGAFDLRPRLRGSGPGH
jgi:hypothetical protein